MSSNNLIVSPIQTALKQFPGMRGLVQRGRYWAWRWRLRGNSRHITDTLDVHRTLWIDPRHIRDICVRDQIDTYAERGQIVYGDWDLHRKPFAELDAFQAFRAHFQEGMAWVDTDFYQRILREMAAGRIRWDSRTPDELAERFRWLDDLYADIRDHGYKPQAQIGAEAGDPLLAEDEVVVAIDRNGDFLFVDGRHRLSIAKLLNVPLIPVKVTQRHADWYQFRQEIQAYAAEHGGRIYHPVTHPDLTDIVAFHEEERFDMLNNHLALTSGHLLDIGAHWGYFSHRFEEVGFTCYAVENDPVNLYFLRKLRDAQQRHFTIIDQSIFDYSDRAQFDVVLALNIFHHFLKTEESYSQLVALLRRLQTKVMFFQAHHPEGQQMEGAYRNFQGDDFVAFILAHSNLTQSEYLGKARDDRPIYKLTA